MLPVISLELEGVSTALLFDLGEATLLLVQPAFLLL
jgi:hypothetical protein